MAKEPLITRKQLRKNKEKQQNQRKEAAVEPVSKFYRKTYAKPVETTKSRSDQKDKSRRLNQFLNRALVTVTLMIIMVFALIIFF